MEIEELPLPSQMSPLVANNSYKIAHLNANVALWGCVTSRLPGEYLNIGHDFPHVSQLSSRENHTTSQQTLYKRVYPKVSGLTR